MTDADRAEIARLRDPGTIRAQAEAMFALAAQDRLAHFALDLAKLPEVAARVVDVTRAAHPDVRAIPVHGRYRHFAAGGLDRLGDFKRRLAAAGADRDEVLRASFELVITSVLLDAGAGESWRFAEPGTGVTLGRSEGLAVASLHMFTSGAFSGHAASPLRADGDKLARLSEGELARALQVSANNPLVGLGGRTALLQALGRRVNEASTFFGGDDGPRLGHLGTHLAERARHVAVPGTQPGVPGTLPATAILDAILQALGPIWPGRESVAGVNLGDVWTHPRLGRVPFHKLSQWLTYSLIEPLEAAGVRITDLDALTGLPEYRNGGLFVDGGVLRPKQASVLHERHEVGSSVIVEWRALTVALLDRVAVEVRRGLGVSPDEMPLARVLEGGTWAAGRQIAREKRPDGASPIAVASDGTVF